jgi:hypothetical protein
VKEGPLVLGDELAGACAEDCYLGLYILDVIVVRFEINLSGMESALSEVEECLFAPTHMLDSHSLACSLFNSLVDNSKAAPCVIHEDQYG